MKIGCYRSQTLCEGSLVTIDHLSKGLARDDGEGRVDGSEKDSQRHCLLFFAGRRKVWRCWTGACDLKEVVAAEAGGGLDLS